MKNNIKLYLCFIVFAFLWGIAPVFSAYGEFIEATPLPELDSNGVNGCAYCGATIQNKTNEKISVEIRLTHVTYKNDSLLVCTKTVELAPHESKDEYLYSPFGYGDSRRSYELSFLVNGKPDEKLTFRTGNNRRDYRNSKGILLDKTISKNDSEKIFYDFGGYGAIHPNTYYYENNIDLMPTNWVAYSQYELLMFYDHNYNSMPDSVKNAILDYVRAGGNLAILGEIDIPSDARDITNTSSSGIEIECRLCFGHMFFLKKNIFNEIKPYEKEKTNSYSYGRSSSSSKPKETKTNSTETVNEKSGSLNKLFDGKAILESLMFSESSRFTGNDVRRFNILAEYTKKYKKNSTNSVLILLVLFFAVVLGPINFLVLHMKDKKILVFISTPIIALICCILVLGYDLVFESWQFDIYRRSITFLNQNDNSAITAGSEIYISGRNRSNTLEYPLNSVIVPYSEYHDYQIPNIERVIKLDNLQKLTQNWIRAKKPLPLAVTSIKQSRARIEVKKTDNGIEILNGLGADIDTIYIASGNGKKIYTFTGIKAGAVANSDSAKVSSISFGKGSYLYSDGLISYETLKSNAFNKVKPGEYIAFLKKDPFMAQEIDSKASVHEMGCAVIGTLNTDKAD